MQTYFFLAFYGSRSKILILAKILVIVKKIRDPEKFIPDLRVFSTGCRILIRNIRIYLLFIAGEFVNELQMNELVFKIVKSIVNLALLITVLVLDQVFCLKSILL
jgi:hypothetical protein